MKNFMKKGCLWPVGILLIIIVASLIWSSSLGARFSSLGACDKGEGCLYTAFNGNRTVRVIGFSADGSHFLTDGSNDGIIHDATNGKKTATLDEGTDNHKYATSHNSNEIIAYRSDSIKFFDWDGEHLRTWTPDADDNVLDADFVLLINGFITAGKKGVSLWEMTDGSLITRLTESGGIMNVAASKDGEIVAAYNFVDDVITVWPLQNLDSQIQIGEVEALSIFLSHDGSLLAAGGSEGAFVWNTIDGSLVTALEPEGQKATATGFSQDGTLLAVGFENGVVVVLDIVNDEILKTFSHEFPPDNLTFLPDNNGLAVGLDYNVTVSGGELIFRPRLGQQNFPGSNLRTDQNRISTEPGYAIVWSLSE